MTLATRYYAGGAPLALLLHGLGDGGFIWQALLPHLLPHSSALTVDLRGHGDSPWDPLHQYSPNVHAADIVALIDGLESPQIVLIGHSLGAEVALRCAAERPARVSGLVLVDGGPGLSQRAASALTKRMQSMRWSYSSVAELAEVLAERHPMAEPKVLGNYAAAALRQVDHASFELRADPALRANLEPPDEERIWRALQNLSCPKLIVRGEASSFLSRAAAERNARSLHDCGVSTVERAGHGVPIDNPQGLLRVLRPFLARVAS